jgi:transposase
MVRSRRKSRLLLSIQQDLLRYFVAGVPARTAAELTGINRNTAILFFHKLRELIADKLAIEAPFLDGEVEVDESYFGGTRKGKRGRGAAGKVPVFGLLKRGGKVHAVMIPDAKSQMPSPRCQVPDAKSLTLMGIMRERILLDSIVYTDCFGSYDVLDVSEFCFAALRVSIIGSIIQSSSPMRTTTSTQLTQRAAKQKLLEPGQTALAQIQRYPESPLPPLLERMRMVL